MFVGSPMAITMRARTLSVRRTLTGLSHEGPHVGVLNHLPKTSMPPLSLNMARMEPVRVIHPTSAERPAASMMTCSVNPSGTTAESSMYFHVSERATRAEAAPPNPLNKATSSGIPVISTLMAMMIPITEPTTRPAMMSSQFMPPDASCMSTMVVNTATSIPMAPY